MRGQWRRCGAAGGEGVGRCAFSKTKPTQKRCGAGWLSRAEVKLTSGRVARAADYPLAQDDERSSDGTPFRKRPPMLPRGPLVTLAALTCYLSASSSPMECIPFSRGRTGLTSFRKVSWLSWCTCSYWKFSISSCTFLSLFFLT